jgi:hypothetical protein
VPATRLVNRAFSSMISKPYLWESSFKTVTKIIKGINFRAIDHLSQIFLIDISKDSVVGMDYNLKYFFLSNSSI